VFTVLVIMLSVLTLGSILALTLVVRPTKTKVHAQTRQPWKKGDSITTTPIDNPMDFREDGSIRPGDPAWEIFEQAMKGGAVMGHQKADGTWTIEKPED
jgi:hypothetical protein